jgi:hypothetical protein
MRWESAKVKYEAHGLSPFMNPVIPSIWALDPFELWALSEFREWAGQNPNSTVPKPSKLGLAVNYIVPEGNPLDVQTDFLPPRCALPVHALKVFAFRRVADEKQSHSNRSNPFGMFASDIATVAPCWNPMLHLFVQSDSKWLFSMSGHQGAMPAVRLCGFGLSSGLRSASKIAKDPGWTFVAYRILNL